MTQFWSVNYIYLVYKLNYFLGMSEILGNIYVIYSSVFGSDFFTFWKLWKLVFWQKMFQNFVFIFSYYPKTAELVLENFQYSGEVGCGKLPDPSLNNFFNVLSIGLKYILSFEWPDFGLKCLFTVVPKSQSYYMKFSHFWDLLIIIELLLWNWKER